MLTSKGAKILFAFFKANKSLKISSISLHRNKLDDDCLKPLGELLEYNQKIEVVYVGGNKITDKGIELFIPYISGNSALKSFGISYCNKITKASFHLLLGLVKNSNVEKVHLDGTQIDEKQFVVILTVNEIVNGSLSKISMGDW